MRHLLGLKNISKEELLRFVINGASFIEVSEREVKKVPTLRGKTIVNLFLEESTRTRSSFEIAGKRLSADTVNLSSSGSSVQKGETLLDTVKTLESMAPDIIVVRNKGSGSCLLLTKYMSNCAIVNAGDGMNEHPTQALLDCLTLKQYFEPKGTTIDKLKIAIVGDVLHSRVARSNIYAHMSLGNEIRLVGPRSLVPEDLQKAFNYKNLLVTNRIEEGISGADVVMVLRLQRERMGQFYIPSLDEYSKEFGVNEKRLSKYAPNSIVLHPGPMNRGVEISSEVADGPRSQIRNQVTNGVAVRMAVLFECGVGGKVDVDSN